MFISYKLWTNYDNTEKMYLIRDDKHSESNNFLYYYYLLHLHKIQTMTSKNFIYIELFRNIIYVIDTISS